MKKIFQNADGGWVVSRLYHQVHWQTVGAYLTYAEAKLVYDRI